jgi:hypothetical protein
MVLAVAAWLHGSAGAWSQVPESGPSPALRVAVVAFEEQGVQSGFGGVVADLLISAVEAPGIELIERAQVRRLLEEQALAVSSLSQPGEAVKYGQLADADLVLVGTVYRIDGTYVVSARMVDAASGVVRESSRASVSFRTVDEMSDRVTELAGRLGLRDGWAAPNIGPRAAQSTQSGDAPPRAATPEQFIEQAGTSAGQVAVALDRQLRSIAIGDPIRFKVTVKEQGYLSILSVDAAGRIAVQVPNDRLASIPVTAGQVLVVPDDLPAPMRLLASPPYGVTRIKAVVTPRPLAHEGIAGRQDGGADPQSFVGAELEFLVVPIGQAVGSKAVSEPGGRQESSVAAGLGDLVAAGLESIRGGSRLPSADEARAMRWPLGGGTLAALDWRDAAVQHDLPRIGVIDADFDPDDPLLARSLRTLSAEDRERLRSEMRRNGHIATRHGNRVASLLGADSPWIPAVIPGVAIVPVRATTVVDGPSYRAPKGGVAEVLAALADAADRGCRVINLSLSVPMGHDERAVWGSHPVWDRLERDRIVVICAAGNDGENLDDAPAFPACVERSNVVCVGASGPDGGLAVWPGGGSAWGANSVDLFAPGVLIVASDGSGLAGPSEGTSYACAFAAGAAAVLISQDPAADAATVVERLRALAPPSALLAGRGRGGLLRWPSAMPR